MRVKESNTALLVGLLLISASCDGKPLQPDGPARGPAEKHAAQAQAPHAPNTPPAEPMANGEAPRSAPSAKTMFDSYSTILARLNSADRSNAFKLQEASERYDREFAAFCSEWVDKWVSVELAVVTVGHDRVVLAADSGDMWMGVGRGEWGEAMPALLDGKSHLVAWARIPEEIPLQRARDMTRGDSFSAIVHIEGTGLLPPGVFDPLGARLAIFARWGTGTESLYDDMNPAKLAARAEATRQTRVADVVAEVRAWYGRVQSEVPKIAADRSPFVNLAATGKMPELENLLSDGRPGQPRRYWHPTQRGLNEGEFSVDALGWNALHHAAFAGQANAVRLLLDTHFNPGDHTGFRFTLSTVETDPPGPLQRSVTALHLASAKGDVDVAALLLPSAMPKSPPWRVSEGGYELTTRYAHRKPHRPDSAAAFLEGTNPFRAPGASPQSQGEWAPELSAKDLPVRRDPSAPHQTFSGDPPLKAVPYAINEPDCDGLTALDYARIFKQSAVEDLLLAAGAKGLLDPKDIERSQQK